MTDAPPISKKRFGCLQVFLFMAAAAVVAGLLTLVAVRTYVFPKAFKPIHLKPHEEQVLQDKLEGLNRLQTAVPSAEKSKPSPAPHAAPAGLEPEPYSEEGVSHVIRFTEREVNALLARNTDLADKVVLDLSEDLISAKILLPMDEDLPVLGGKTLRLRAGLAFAYKEGRPYVAVRGLTCMGIGIPNAWLGGIKNVDLVQAFGQGPGFWQLFADGVADMKVEEGRLTIELKE